MLIEENKRPNIISDPRKRSRLDSKILFKNSNMREFHRTNVPGINKSCNRTCFKNVIVPVFRLSVDQVRRNLV